MSFHNILKLIVNGGTLLKKKKKLIVGPIM